MFALPRQMERICPRSRRKGMISSAMSAVAGEVFDENSSPTGSRLTRRAENEQLCQVTQKSKESTVETSI